eukprot:6226388-Amphidinium_carterae.1
MKFGSCFGCTRAQTEKVCSSLVSLRFRTNSFTSPQKIKVRIPGKTLKTWIVFEARFRWLGQDRLQWPLLERTYKAAPGWKRSMAGSMGGKA